MTGKDKFADSDKDSNFSAENEYEGEFFQSVGISNHLDLFENSHVAILIVNSRTGRIIDANNAACMLYGYERPHMKDAEIEEIEYIEDIEMLSIGENTNKTVGKSKTVVHRLSGGKCREVEVLKVPSASDEDISYFIVNDISEIRHIKKELELRKSYFQQLFENSPEAIAILDNEDRVVKVNRGFEELFKYSNIEIKGNYINDLIVSQELKLEASTLSGDVVCAKTVKRDSIRCTKHGEDIDVSILGYPIIHDGVQVGIYAIYTDITEKKKREKKIEYLAMKDSLTGTYNRSYFIENLMKEIMHRKADSHNGFAVMFIDVDDFKRINDNMGHNVGDMILRQISKRIVECIGEKGYLARMGGDEFTVFLKNVDSRVCVANIAREIVESLEEPIIYDEKEFHVGVSIGISLFPDDGYEAEMLIRKADMAMYNSKMNRSNNFEFYNSDLKKKALEEFILENELRHAIKREEFSLNYQPLVDVSSEKIVGVEALIRWNHKEHGFVSPAKFIPLAERKGMIGFIGEWVLEKACRQMKKWIDSGYPVRFIAVNISVKQLESLEFLDNVKRIIRETGINPRHLEFEITESISMTNLKNRTEILRELDDMGIALSIDDFGTGYSSLGKLKKFAVRKLKIDRSFISDINIDPNNTAIVSTIIAIAKILNMKVVAEGVETLEQVEFLREKECDLIQGYYYSRPVTFDEFEKMIPQEI
ncbi:EAL and GGDEF domain-containing protein [Peptoclostridium litorale]|nr:EAL domain-containing protein [Peptoclostridium litorale]